MNEQYSIVYRYYNFFMHLSIDEHLGYFHVLATVNCAAVDTGVHMSFWIVVFLEYMPSNGIAGSYSSFITSFLRNLYPYRYFEDK